MTRSTVWEVVVWHKALFTGTGGVQYLPAPLMVPIPVYWRDKKVKTMDILPLLFLRCLNNLNLVERENNTFSLWR